MNTPWVHHHGAGHFAPSRILSHWPAYVRSGSRTSSSGAVSPICSNHWLDLAFPPDASTMRSPSMSIESAAARAYVGADEHLADDVVVINCLSITSATTAQEIVRYTGCPKNSISRAVAKHEAEGVLRRKAHLRDGRASTLSLTPRGKKLFSQIKHFFDERDQRLIEVLSEKEKKSSAGCSPSSQGPPPTGPSPRYFGCGRSVRNLARCSETILRCSICGTWPAF